ncbi:hypothetical protein V0R50_13155 [Pseudomonas sp. 148P]|uniref:Type I restriction enzyme R protein N-terminal domain-containing protein n=1 Tax=Pseudomonas ulcerans TaxID=3115852 RepID=A0ABU7HRL2_9PSED|nr:MULTISPECIES: hypothetical protein [unclassified Pseudomonas]MEE1923213.1 hypothetical protein [Pseudomonas sp. 147P]MEE1934175.1 hypothetical protein [Pseudomonas sp. 148P]
MIDVSYNSLKSPEFKEDSVREEIITPILKKLGYRAEGDARISRSKTLKNPFIRVGTSNHPVTTIPDYTLYFKETPVLVIDAKKPSEDITSEQHIQQAYSYAVHPEVRCQHFALCNGLRFVLFNLERPTPILDLEFDEYLAQWEKLEKHLKPQNLIEPALALFAPDAGFACARMGIGNGIINWFPASPSHFARLDKNTITISSNVELSGSEYCISFDLDESLLPKILECLPQGIAKDFTNALDSAPFQAESNHMIEIDITTHLGTPIKNQHETFIPFLITKIHNSRLLPPTSKKQNFQYFQLIDCFKNQEK